MNQLNHLLSFVEQIKEKLQEATKAIEYLEKQINNFSFIKMMNCYQNR